MAATTRISWLVAGTAFGLGCFSALTPLAISLVTPTIHISGDTDSADKSTGRSLEAIVAAAPEDKAPLEALNHYHPLAMTMTVENGDTLGSLLAHSGISNSEAHEIVEAIRPVYDPRKLDIGTHIVAQFSKEIGDDGEATLQNLTLPVSQTSTVELERKADDSFNVTQIDIPVEHKLAHAGGTIDSSLYQTGIEGGLPPALLNELISAYSYDVDFQRDIKKGNVMDVLYERTQTKDGTQVGNGSVVFANLELGDRTIKIYRYVGHDGTSDYYNDKGESVRKALLRTPINGAKITSGFGMRNHPILGYSRMHKGVDFGAAIGTPIYAAGDGVVEFVGQKSGYGNFVKIKHTNQYSSGYGHCSRFAAIHPGSKVKQGQIIAYVGMTGMATGPHLHYEIFAGGEQVNPANVKFKTGNVLAGKELLAFRQTVQNVEAKIASLPRGGVVAMNKSDQTFN